MKEKIFRLTKTALLLAVLAVTAVGVFPTSSAAEPGDWTLVCSGPGDWCAYISDSRLPFDILVLDYAFESFTIEL